MPRMHAISQGAWSQAVSEMSPTVQRDAVCYADLQG